MKRFLYKRGRLSVLLSPILSLMLVFSFFASSSTTFAAAHLIRISTDPYTNSTSQHKTEVEPDSLSFGDTIVSVFQVGRFFNGGSSNIGWATSNDRGKTWKHGFLPATTVYATPPGPYARASDASIAYDPRHKVWMTSYLGINAVGNSITSIDVVVSRSTDGGFTWGSPVPVALHTAATSYDKNWSVCDTSLSSPFYGHCYTQFDDNGQGDLILMSTSADGGLSWGPPATTADGAHGIGGQPLVQPSGRVVVPIIGLDSPFFAFTISSFISTDGGANWGPTVLVSEGDFHTPAGGIRAGIPLPTAEIDRKGKIYVAWSDCRFEASCSASDIVLSTSTNGLTWSTVKRIPIDGVGSGVDHFLPGLAVDRKSSGGDAHLGLVYYYYPNTNCTATTCRLNVGFTSSTNGGASWSHRDHLAGPMQLNWLPVTTQGVMVGDYFSTSIAPGSDYANPFFMVALPPHNGMFDQAAYTALEQIQGGPDSLGNDKVFSSRSQSLRQNVRPTMR